MKEQIYTRIKELERIYFSHEIFNENKLRKKYPDLSDYDYKIFKKLLFVGMKEHYEIEEIDEFSEAIYKIMQDRNNEVCQYEFIVNEMQSKYYKLILQEILEENKE